jgi:hypothetical protein
MEITMKINTRKNAKGPVRENGPESTRGAVGRKMPKPSRGPLRDGAPGLSESRTCLKGDLRDGGIGFSEDAAVTATPATRRDDLRDGASELP